MPDSQLTEGDIWETIVRPGNKLHIGTKVIFGDGLLTAEILDTMPGGTRKVLFTYKGIFNEIRGFITPDSDLMVQEYVLSAVAGRFVEFSFFENR